MIERARVIESAEQALKVFISGRITPAREWIRQEAEATLRRLPFVATWLFEHTPPSAEALDEGYLRHVREADFLVWLADDDVTDPVEAELNEAFAAGVPVMAFLLPVAERSARLEALIAQLRARVRTCTLPTENELRAALPLALGDELIRALRGARPSRRRTLVAMGLDSRARTIARLQAAGLGRARATQLVDILGQQSALDPFIPTPDQPLRLIVAPVGAGKTLIGERCLQRAIALAIADPMAPAPLYERIGSIEVGLTRWVEDAATLVGDPRTVGAFVVLDGADEPGSRAPARLLEEARALVSAIPATSIIITTRPIPVLTEAREAVTVPELSETEAMELIARISGEPLTPGGFWSLSTSLREAVRRPLFAVMYAVLRSTDSRGRVRAVADLVRLLVEHVLAGRDDLAPGLERLAAAGIAQGTATVHVSAVGSFGDAQALLNTALVAQEGDAIRFGLAILQEWFGAQHLLRARNFETELASEALRDRWRQAAAIAITQVTPARANAMLGWLLRGDPAFATIFIRQIETHASFEAGEPLPRTGQQYAEDVQFAVERLASGLGPIGRAILPIAPDGRPYSFGASADRDWLLWGLSRSEVEPRAFELQDGALRDEARWRRRGHMRLEDRPGWAFGFVLSDLRRELRAGLNAAALELVGCAPYEAEMRWLLALALLGRGEFNFRSIPLSELRPRADWLKQGEWVRRRHVILPTAPLLRVLEDEHAAELRYPWATPDIPGISNWIWAPYSPGQMLTLTVQVHEAALQIYRALVQGHFRSVATRLRLWRLLPARLIGVLQPGSPLSFEGHPGLHFYFTPLPAGAEGDVVNITLEASTAPKIPDPEALMGEYRRLRPDATEWLFPSTISAALEVFAPGAATRLAYRWLSDDLADIGLVDASSLGPEF